MKKFVILTLCLIILCGVIIVSADSANTTAKLTRNYNYGAYAYDFSGTGEAKYTWLDVLISGYTAQYFADASYNNHFWFDTGNLSYNLPAGSSTTGYVTLTDWGDYTGYWRFYATYSASSSGTKNFDSEYTVFTSNVMYSENGWCKIRLITGKGDSDTSTVYRP